VPHPTRLAAEESRRIAASGKLTRSASGVDRSLLAAMTGPLVRGIVPAMEPTPLLAEHSGRDAEERLRVHAWRAEQLQRLGMPFLLAETFADRIDWHSYAELVARGCSPRLAFEIVR